MPRRLAPCDRSFGPPPNANKIDRVGSTQRVLLRTSHTKLAYYASRSLGMATSETRAKRTFNNLIRTQKRYDWLKKERSGSHPPLKPSCRTPHTAQNRYLVTSSLRLMLLPMPRGKEALRAFPFLLTHCRRRLTATAQKPSLGFQEHNATLFAIKLAALTAR